MRHTKKYSSSNKGTFLQNEKPENRKESLKKKLLYNDPHRDIAWFLYWTSNKQTKILSSIQAKGNVTYKRTYIFWPLNFL